MSADAGGAAPQPHIETFGDPPPPVAPEGYILVPIPRPSPQQQVDGAIEHASMLRGIADAAQADLARMREHAEGQLAAQQQGAERCAAEADAAEQWARDLAGQHGIDVPAELPRHATFAFLDEGQTGPAPGGDL